MRRVVARFSLCAKVGLTATAAVVVVVGGGGVVVVVVAIVIAVVIVVIVGVGFLLGWLVTCNRHMAANLQDGQPDVPPEPARHTP